MWTIYNMESGYSAGHYETERKASNALKKYIKYEATQRKPRNYVMVTREWYDQHVNILVERVNLMTGKAYMERLNTPANCSPASESYWSS